MKQCGPEEPLGTTLEFYGRSTQIPDCRDISVKAPVGPWMMPSRFAGPSAELLGNVSALLPGAVFPIISSAVVLSPLRSWAQLDLPVCF